MKDPIVILCPMSCESRYLTDRIRQKLTRQIGGYVFYEGTLEGVPAVVVQCMIGTVNASVSTLLAIQQYAPRCVILQGTAGSHDPDLSPQDIVIAKKMVSLTHYMSDSRRPGEGCDPLRWDQLPIQAYVKQSGKTEILYEFFSDNALLQKALTVPYTQGKVVTGTVAAGDMWNREADFILHCHNERGTTCEAMEGVAVAQVCAVFGVPMIEIRVISNNELHPNEKFSVQTALCVQQFVCDYIAVLAEPAPPHPVC